MSDVAYCSASGKIKYEGRREARAAIIGLSKRRGGRAVRFYRCNHCRRWHITSVMRPVSMRSAT